MPIYEYRCQKGHSFDVMQSMSDDPMTSCQICGAPVQKVLHAPAVHFKGSGFYATDYGKKKPPAGVGGDQKKDKAESNGSAGGSDSGSSSESGSSSSDSGSDSGKKSETKSASSSKSD